MWRPDSDSRIETERCMSTRNQLVCLWTGYAFFILYLLGIVVVAGFIPPPAPSMSGEQVAAFFDQRHGRILVGMSICAVASALYVPWGVAILGQMLRTEKSRFPALSAVQVISAGLGAAFFALSPLFWLTIAYRTGHAGDTVGILNDFAWISWIVSWPFFSIQAGALGLCILTYPAAEFPRWVGYLSIWFAISMFPASLIVFFYSGPLAWNGLFGIYLPLAMFALWYNTVSFYLLKAVKAEANVETLRSSEQPS
jgi:MFS family permease